MSRLSVLVLTLALVALLLIGLALGTAYFNTKTLQGTITEAQGAPIPQAALTLAGRSTFSDDKGYFAIQFPRGDWELRAFANGFQPTAQPIAASDFWNQQFTTRVTLQPQAWHGQIVTADGKPIPNLNLGLDGQTLITDANGEFVAAGVRNGATLKLTAPGYRPVTLTLQNTANNSATVTTTADQPTRIQLAPAEPAVTLKPAPTTLQGRILDSSTNNPVPNALVLLAGKDGSIVAARPADANGVFALDDISRVATLYLKKPGYRLGAFDIQAGGQQTYTLAPFQAKGIHLYYGIPRADAERVLDQLKNTEMNAVVFDVKEAPGYLLWDSRVPLAKQIGAYAPRSYTAPDMVAACRAYKLYCIARVTVMKDTLLARNRPDLALRNAGGGLLYENSAYWTNPAKKEVQDYATALALELAAMGFDEIQFDYIRFPGTTNVLGSQFGSANYRVTTIQSFLARAADALRPTPAFFSGDVFGLTTAITDEQGIGQIWEQLAPTLDYISPMLYPSTWRYATNLWGAGFGIKNCSDAYVCPYDIIRYGTEKARQRTPNHWTLVRPWIQAYGMDLDSMLAQAKGADDANSQGYLFWNNQGIYPDGLFKKRE